VSSCAFRTFIMNYEGVRILVGLRIIFIHSSHDPKQARNGADGSNDAAPQEDDGVHTQGVGSTLVWGLWGVWGSMSRLARYMRRNTWHPVGCQMMGVKGTSRGVYDRARGVVPEQILHILHVRSRRSPGLSSRAPNWDGWLLVIGEPTQCLFILCRRRRRHRKHNTTSSQRLV
jgi:hypothetical protein